MKRTELLSKDPTDLDFLIPVVQDLGHTVMNLMEFFSGEMLGNVKFSGKANWDGTFETYKPNFEDLLPHNPLFSMSTRGVFGLIHDDFQWKSKDCETVFEMRYWGLVRNTWVLITVYFKHNGDKREIGTGRNVVRIIHKELEVSELIKGEGYRATELAIEIINRLIKMRDTWKESQARREREMDRVDFRFKMYEFLLAGIQANPRRYTIESLGG